MKINRYTILAGLVFLLHTRTMAQRSYAAHSVLATGTWYKISVKEPGVYKIDISFLNALGVSASNISSASIRLYGNGGHMLSESNAGEWMDDLVENAIEINDGGDGVFNGNDYLLFYANGPHKWIKDSINQRFIHQLNLYAEHSYYFLTFGGTGKRITNLPATGGGIPVNSFSERIFHELDSLNFLSSGKEWYGEEFANAPGKSLTRNISFPIPDLVSNSNAQIIANLVARSVGTSSRFDLQVNGQMTGQVQINPVAGGQYDEFARQGTLASNAIISQGPINVSFTYVPGSFNAQGWLNRMEIFLRRGLVLPPNGQLLFRDWTSVGSPVVEFQLSQANTGTRVWDITNPLQPERLAGTLNGSIYRFSNSGSRLHEYVAFSNIFLIPSAIGKINNQDLHDASPKDFIIISYPDFILHAQRLADLHLQKNGLRCLVVSTTQVFNEFSSGNPDPTALRDFVKMYHDKFGSQPANILKYLLLFGDASFDYKNRVTNNTNFVPAYQSVNSLDPLSTYTSDDFFGFLDDNEDINSGLIVNYLDIGIGRLPAKNPDEASQYVDKVYAYLNAKSFGPWRNNLSLVADDEDQNLHLNDAELFSSTINLAAPVFNQQKIYLDAFQQESGAGGSRYPQVNQAINNQVLNGILIWNYNGHGGSRRLAEETILEQQMVNSWNNETRLPLFITATCDFAPFDQPLVNSLGENIILRPRTGGIALMTTTRVVFAFSNRIMNNNYLQFALQPDANGSFRSLGKAVMDAKNFTYQTSGDVTNNRKFTLLGDPALELGFPKMRVRAVSINNIPVSQADTLNAMENVTIEAEVTDRMGNPLNNFNGTGYISVFDKAQLVQTRGNDPASIVTTFPLQSNVLFRGKSTVTNGKFSVRFKVPKDINYQVGNGKLSLYAENGITDANGFFTGFLVGGISTSVQNDNAGPRIRAWLNDEKFVNGGITNENPILIVKLTDTSGINTTGTGIGHDIIATLDNDPAKYFILNDFFETALDSYQEGSLRFQLPELEAGSHTLNIKAWDVLNNSSEISIEFIVTPGSELQIAHVLNYPNPFSTNTSFWFEHNQPGQSLQVYLQIFTITGKLVKTFRETVVTEGTRFDRITWNGRDEYGDKLARGVYLYRLRVTSQNKKWKQVTNKLVIF